MGCPPPLFLVSMANPMSFKQLFDLSGRTALITGSTRGLGFSYAEGLAEAGAHVIVNGTRAEGVAEAVSKLTAKGPLSPKGRRRMSTRNTKPSAVLLASH